MKVEEINDPKVVSKIQDYECRGGVLVFKLYQLSDRVALSTNNYQYHLVIARQTLEKTHYEIHSRLNSYLERGKRSAFPTMVTDITILDESGVKISLEHFLGPYYDTSTGKPLIRGIQGNRTMNSYFFYDEEELPGNTVDLGDKMERFDYQCPDAEGGFVYAFMEPPYGLRAGKSIFERGKYLMGFMDYFFWKKERLEVYSWSTDCSPFFDAGKEWWGAFFWTVYCPDKDWYIGILGSSSD